MADVGKTTNSDTLEEFVSVDDPDVFFRVPTMKLFDVSGRESLISYPRESLGIFEDVARLDDKLTDASTCLDLLNRGFLFSPSSGGGGLLSSPVRTSPSKTGHDLMEMLNSPAVSMNKSGCSLRKLALNNLKKEKCETTQSKGLPAVEEGNNIFKVQCAIPAEATFLATHMKDESVLKDGVDSQELFSTTPPDLVLLNDTDDSITANANPHDHSSINDTLELRNANEIMKNLASIISTCEQRSEGLNLLQNLTFTLNKSWSLSFRRLSSGESGQSSLEGDRDKENRAPSNVSHEPKVVPVNKSPNVKKIGKSPNVKKIGKSPNVKEKPAEVSKTVAVPILKPKQINIINSFDQKNKLKPKKPVQQNKGPLKAVIPVNNMSKASKESEIKSSAHGLKVAPSTSNTKKSTTPKLLQSKFRPVAQSTPTAPNKPSDTDPSPSRLPKRSLNCSISPFSARPNTPTASSAKLNISTEPSTSLTTRRRSTDQIVRKQTEDKLKRSNSVTSKRK